MKFSKDMALGEVSLSLIPWEALNHELLHSEASCHVLVAQLCPPLCDPVDRGQRTRLLCPWNSPGKNTGVGCHSLHPGDLPNPGSELGFPSSQAKFLPSEPSEVKAANPFITQPLSKAFPWVGRCKLLPLSPGPVPGEEAPESQGQCHTKGRRPEPEATNTPSTWGMDAHPVKGHTGRASNSIFCPSLRRWYRFKSEWWEGGSHGKILGRSFQVFLRWELTWHVCSAERPLPVGWGDGGEAGETDLVNLTEQHDTGSSWTLFWLPLPQDTLHL